MGLTMDDAFVRRVRAMVLDGWDERCIAKATKKSLTLVQSVVVAIRARPPSPGKQATMKASLALVKLDRGYKAAGARPMPNGKLKLRGTA